MNYNTHCVKEFLALLIFAAFMAPAWAQVKKPAAEAKKTAADKKEKKEAKPAFSEELGPKSDRPAVQAILLSNPSAPAEYARAAKLLADLSESELSKMYLKRILSANLDSDQLADLGDKFGSALFLDLANRKDLQPEASELAKAVLAAVNKRLEDPERITRLIEQLQDPSPDVRSKAMVGLASSRLAAVRPLIQVLADKTRAAERANVRDTLALLGADAVDPLVGMLENGDPAFKVQIIQILAGINSHKAEIYLLEPCLGQENPAEVRAAAAAALQRLSGRLPSRSDALRDLIDKSRAYSEYQQPIETQTAGEVTLWTWDARQKQCLAKTYAIDDASRALAARLARDAFRLAPRQHQVQSLFLATMFEEAAYQNGLDKPLPMGPDSAVGQAAGTDAGAIEAALAYAVAHKLPAAGAVAARLLGQLPGAQESLFRGSEPAALAAAACSPDRRLRLAADEAIVRLKPRHPYAGSSSVLQSLGFFIATHGAPRALVGALNTEAARELAGFFTAEGLDVDTATSGREFFRLAAASPDYQVALIDAGIDRPTIDPLIQQLRQDWRTADLRVGLIARAAFFQEADRLAQRYPLTLSCPKPLNEAAFRRQFADLMAMAPKEYVSNEVRRAQAETALDLLIELSDSPKGIYDFTRIQDALLTATTNPDLYIKAAAVLGKIGTAESQHALVELANRSTLPLERRKAAAAAVAENIGKFGVLLTSEEVRRQYDLYKQSDSLDPETRQILRQVLDSIEATRKKEVGSG
jgi:hypothetical protein